MRLANSNTCGIVMLRIRRNLLFLMIACLIFVQACSMVAPTVSVEEIASKTGKLIAEVEYGLEYDDVVLLVRHIDKERIPSVVEWQKDRIRAVFSRSSEIRHQQISYWPHLLMLNELSLSRAG
jgi:hypothetical protein